MARILFFFNDTATTEIYTLSLHDALPISLVATRSSNRSHRMLRRQSVASGDSRSEEHTSELQSQSNLVCRLLLEKKKRHSWSLSVVNVLLTTSSSITLSGEQSIASW